jgi:hypothetical protein
LLLGPFLFCSFVQLLSLSTVGVTDVSGQFQPFGFATNGKRLGRSNADQVKDDVFRFGMLIAPI